MTVETDERGRQIVGGAELGQLLDLSDRSIREHRAKGHVHRLGKGYDLRRSVIGMMDHYRLEALRNGHGKQPHVWGEIEARLEYARAVSVRAETMAWVLRSILALPDLPPLPKPITDALAELQRPSLEEADEG